VLAFALALQCAYAVFAYFQGVNQFHTPYFGNRTCGTFDNPNSLYPLCLFAVGLGVGLAQAVEDRFSRCLFAGVALLGVTALTLTFTRSAWLALSGMGTYLGLSGLVAFPKERMRKNALTSLIIGAAVVLLLATALVRTHGRIAGNPEDRSFWGRVAIWQTAWNIFRERPLLGHGFATYAEVQFRPRHLTPTLQHYNPRNSEAKNLGLNLACEFGLGGLVVWGWLIVAYLQMFRFGCQVLRTGTPDWAVFIGIHTSLLGLMVAGLFDTPILARGREAATLMTFICLGAMCHLVSEASLPPVETALETEGGESSETN
jgi:O-antigen ligase